MSNGFGVHPDYRILGRAELVQLLSYAQARDEGNQGGWYYGNRKHFEMRHQIILKYLEKAIQDYDAKSLARQAGL